ncbi:dienelactone hydrolase [Capsaspora owczarzaki ATCC 30864]|uniref:Dienelactone hydrolase n=1 Tax=Capsaspora owczarzaki (strain ATCC 30864) TaxID=595528 RepID=A0A0D2VSG7_CAPO3|nr:dienelactone hydrolase [Capsaspora owczarzaki ATCC 30864]KJE94032.1 dienelactone hydrolase [Capsaspora owczarzaki ATCC 30864]|eukprot:XP_004347479.2 dienelactone hydrolase [Capsaspora owczarzaki ATCC 30864]
MTLTETTVTYHDQGSTLIGFMAAPATIAAGTKLPAVLIIHDWKGIGDYVRERARILARKGYVAFAVDQYGDGKHAATHEEAAALMQAYTKDSTFALNRTLAGLNQLIAHPHVDASKIVCYGYCFGGTCCLELARHNAPVAGVAGFHAGLQSFSGASNKNIKTRVAMFHGYNDPWISREAVQNFTKELSEAQVDFTFVDFGNTVHAFTVPGINNPPAMIYNESSDKQSWAYFEFWLHHITLGGAKSGAPDCCNKGDAGAASCH